MGTTFEIHQAIHQRLRAWLCHHQVVGSVKEAVRFRWLSESLLGGDPFRILVFGLEFEWFGVDSVVPVVDAIGFAVNVAK